MKLQSFVQGRWADGTDTVDVASAFTGDCVAQATSGGLDMAQTLAFARNVGAVNLRKLTFHQRADLLKKLGQCITERKNELYDLSFQTGATRIDNMIDVDGGIGTLFAYAGVGRREMPNSKFLLDGEVESLSKGGSFIGRHI